ncbi:MAG: hypothetical protein ACT4P6_18595 [Gemmatimonadaceae bacterium]
MQRVARQTMTGGNASLAAGGGALSGALEASIAGTGARVKPARSAYVSFDFGLERVLHKSWT